ncbi:MAG: hemolysin family protein [bacterium]|jgi:CBS domain containing-hemolysin-like protein
MGVLENLSLYQKLLLVFLLILLNAFFVLVEFSLVASNELKLKRIKFSLPYKQFKNLDHYLATCQVGITLASLILGWLAEPTFSFIIKKLFNLFKFHFNNIHSFSIVLSFVFVTFLHLVLGEQVPKLFAVYRPERMIIIFSPFLEIFNYIFLPLTLLVKITQNKIANYFGLDISESHNLRYSVDEIKEMLFELSNKGIINEKLSDIINGVLKLNEKKVKDIMIHRTNIVALNQEMRIENVIDIIVNNLHSRYPVYKDDIDNIVGIFHIKDFFVAIKKKVFYLKELLELVNRKVLYVPENGNLFNVLQEMQRTQNLMAIVIDEFGGTKGIITFDDILSVIIGTILDEFDLQKLDFFKTYDGYIINTNLHLNELPQEVKDILKQNNVYYDNILVSNLVYEYLAGKKPKNNEILKIGNLKIRLLDVKGNSVKYIKIYK